MKESGECMCGLKRDIECDDAEAMQRIKNMPCPNCGGRIKYKSSHENLQYTAETTALQPEQASA